MRNFFKELRDNTGYYYTDERINLNDFLIFFALILVVIVIIFVGSTQSNVILDAAWLIFSPFYAPFLIHFFCKIIKIISFKLKKKIILSRGQAYSARIIDSKKGKTLYNDQITEVKKYSYYPVVTYYDNGTYNKLTSSFPVNNTHTLGLSSNQVTIHIYKNKFIISDFALAGSASESLHYRTTRNYNSKKTLTKTDVLVLLTIFVFLILILLSEIVLQPLLNNLFEKYIL